MGSALNLQRAEPAILTVLQKAVLGGKLVFKARGPVHAVWEVGTSFPRYRWEAEAQKDHSKAGTASFSTLPTACPQPSSRKHLKWT